MVLSKNNLPKISIVTPSFNQGKYIEDTIESVVSQNYPNLEYIIIDGGSSDETLEIIKKHEKNISHWVSESDKGQTHAINKGFKLSTGDICTWINSDDLIYNDALWTVAEHFSKDEELEFIHGRGLYFDDKGNEWKADKNLDNLEIRYITHFCYDLQPSTYYRRRIFDIIGYLDESYILQMDAEFFMRVGLNCKIKKVKDLLSKFREHTLRKSNLLLHQERIEKEFFRRYSKILRSFDFTDDLIKCAKDLKVYYHEEGKYPVLKSFNRNQLEHSFFIFLVMVMEGKYLRGDYDGTKKLIRYLEHDSSPSFGKNKTISKIRRRLHFEPFLPLGLIKKVRGKRTQMESIH